MKALALITLTVLLIGVAGCGQKGPLYLPEDAPDNEPAAGQLE